MLVLALVVLLAPVGAAQAGIIRSEDVLPAGQSGFVGADGTGSPHLYDQLPLFLSFSYKPADLNGAGSAQETPRPGVAIARDGYGVPSVTGTTEDDLWWGAGYAVAQDRLAELELFRRRGNGTLAEILGKSMLADDIVDRRDYYTTPELQAMLARLPADIQARFRAYAAGVNAWIDHVRQTPADLPLEFSALKIPLRPWSVLDSLRIGVLLARTIPTGDGEELDNLAALRAFGPSTFAKILPLRVSGQITTIPAADGTFPSQPGRTRAQERAAFARSQRFVRSLPLAPVVGASAGVPTGKASPAHAIDVGLGHLGGSFMWAIRRPSDGHTFLVNGPQLGYQAPSTFVELDLHGPGTDVRGGSAPGVPIMGPGHNAHVAWGFTSGLSDDNDLYAERLAGPGSRRYRFRGRELTMSCRREVFRYRDGDATRAVPKTLCRSVHGPVQAESGRVAYARRYALWKREGETITGLTALNDASNLQEVDRALRQVSWNENIVAADDRGDIGFWHPGLHPLRPLGWDERLPYPGTGEAEWRGLLPRARDPHVINPRGRNWVANWNNVPSADWTLGRRPRARAPQRPLPPHRRAGSAGQRRGAGSDLRQRRRRRRPPQRGHRDAVPHRAAAPARRGPGCGRRRGDGADHPAVLGRQLRPHRSRRHRRPRRGHLGGVQGGRPARRGRRHHAGQAGAGRHAGRRGLRGVDPGRDLRPAHAGRGRAAPRGCAGGNRADRPLRQRRPLRMARAAQHGHRHRAGPCQPAPDPAHQPRFVRADRRARTVKLILAHAHW